MINEAQWQRLVLLHAYGEMWCSHPELTASEKDMCENTGIPLINKHALFTGGCRLSTKGNRYKAILSSPVCFSVIPLSLIPSFLPPPSLSLPPSGVFFPSPHSSYKNRRLDLAPSLAICSMLTGIDLGLRAGYASLWILIGSNGILSLPQMSVRMQPPSSDCQESP